MTQEQGIGKVKELFNLKVQQLPYMECSKLLRPRVEVHKIISSQSNEFFQ